ncbi:uncharacterized protein LOC128391255 [Panonychus citri]|uniref:uncharacterized protein LOC128391255 n=1 Tax=Panonychus citri TaxID=50023 RepID=UPI0023078AFA|nr:uncharacterized protein LOC128391255 [Panonychus citri]
MDNKIDFILDETLSNLEPNFITDIRSLTTIMSSPYDKWNDWDIIGVKIGDKIILHEVDTTMRKNYIARQTDTQNASSYAEYKFESLVTRRFDGKKCSTYYGELRDSFHGVLVTKTAGGHHARESHGRDEDVHQILKKKVLNLVLMAIYTNAVKLEAINANTCIQLKSVYLYKKKENINYKDN